MHEAYTYTCTLTCTDAGNPAHIPFVLCSHRQFELGSTFFPWSISMAELHTHFHTHNESIFSLFYPNVSRSSARLKALLLVLSIQNKYSKTEKEDSKSYTSRTVHMLLNYYISVRRSVFRWDQNTGVIAREGKRKVSDYRDCYSIHVYISLYIMPISPVCNVGQFNVHHRVKKMINYCL